MPARMQLSTALLLVAAACVAGWAQEAPQNPTIRVPTRLVQIGVIARGSDGPVADLTKDDFVVLDRGKPQKISVFTLEAIPSTTPAATTASQPAQTLPQNTFSDLPQYGADRPRSVTIVLLDNLNTLYATAPMPYEDVPSWLEDHALANAKQHLIEFLNHADPNDRIAIYSLTHILRVLCDFTCNRDQLLSLVSKYDPRSITLRESAEAGNFHFPPGTPPQFEIDEDANAEIFAGISNQTREQTTMDALTAIAGHVADIPGRKNLLWLTANLPFSGRAIARILSRANIAAYPLDARGLLPRLPQDTGEGNDEQAAHLFGTNGGPATMSAEPIGIASMRDMASDTGGRAFVNTNDLTGAIRQAVEDSAVTYTLGFYIDRDSIDGKFHEIKVEVKRKGVTLRYPRGYFAFEDTPVTKDESRSNLVVAVRSPIESSAIPMHVRIEKVEKPLPHCLSILGSIDIHNLRLAENGNVRTGAIDVVTVEQDQTGKVLAQSFSAISLRFGEKPYAVYLKSGFPFHQFVQPKPGTATLRILVQDSSTAQVGSLIIPLTQVN